ncbi:MAG: hypothetical protein KKE51_17620 [Gammaproteobacteria bacterium]|nr:hypothetical protein [Gammaproteobacteria bacterium]MBU1601433.1 hypothetical protein [Gammaproteobacteria bacterium]MBU2433628.1 hypothetical protein [Gammaproteobacteria bacterium]MBU2449834.1 hypothetical protein [Gammaproteobacteria bacterium]
MDEFEKIAKQKEFERFEKVIGAESDPTMRVLRAHLFSENLLERLLIVKLPRGDKIIENGNLTYHQKLVLIESLDFIPDSIISALRNLNKLRNLCAHELNKTITESDITKIGSPLGKSFTSMKRSAKFDDAVLLGKVIASICGHLAGACNRAEHPEAVASEKSTETKRITKRSIGPARKAAQSA